VLTIALGVILGFVGLRLLASGPAIIFAVALPLLALLLIGTGRGGIGALLLACLVIFWAAFAVEYWRIQRSDDVWPKQRPDTEGGG
jgi:hypothetical protein